jgi:alpha-tubulin suppressor-like RCC1 family protein
MAQRSTCAIVKSGAVSCWGMGAGGALGGGKSGATPMDDSADAYAPQSIDSIGDPMTAIAGGGTHYCAITKSGAVWCWGEGGFPKTCSDPNADCYTPEAIAGVADAVDISSYGDATCAVRKGGALACWGEPFGASTGKNAPWKGGGPAKVDGLANVARVFGGYRMACAARRDGTVACFGDAVSFELNQRKDAKAVFAEMKGARDLALVGIGQPIHVVGKSGDVRALDWSYAIAPDPKHAAPVALSPPLARVIATDVVQIAQRQYATCARKRSGEVVCWDASGKPAAIGIDDAADVALSEQGAGCAARKNGEVWCWGENSNGECGQDPRVVVAAPNEVAGLPAN